MHFGKKDVIKTETGKALRVKELLGEGGQGSVYLVENTEDKSMLYALKVYKEKVNPDFRYNLKNNIEKGSPSASFLWPKELLCFEDGTIGYLMDLRPKNFVSFVSYLNGQKPFANLTVKLRWCSELCLAFKRLHELGYSYQDLNDGSFFLDPDTGDLLICDNDNVTADKKNLGILGKMRYMAPEIVRGDKDASTGNPQLPDIHSDRFSLAVILFLTLCLGNPFEGERLKQYEITDEQSDYEMFGASPVFIYHRSDASNRPIRGYHTCPIKYWPRLPQYMQDAFHRTFTDGLSDRENGRVTEIEWLRLISQYRDELVTCGKCGESFPAFAVQEQMCPFCRAKNPPVLALYVGRTAVALTPGKQLFATHVDKYSSDYNKIAGTVVVNPQRPDLWGIRLLDGNEAEIRDAAGTVKSIAQNGVIPILKNLTVTFRNQMTGEIK